MLTSGARIADNFAGIADIVGQDIDLRRTTAGGPWGGNVHAKPASEPHRAGIVSSAPRHTAAQTKGAVIRIAVIGMSSAGDPVGCRWAEPGHTVALGKARAWVAQIGPRASLARMPRHRS
jgi:hypothetical protein